MRAKVAMWLVHRVGMMYDASYAMWCEWDMGGRTDHAYRDKSEALGTRAAKWAGRLLPLAQRIHKDAAVDQMIAEGWWG